MADAILIGSSDSGPQMLTLKRANRHGLVAGATGTGKTVTLQVLAESFAREGVPVFAADVKGDLSGIAMQGDGAQRWADRAKETGVPDYTPQSTPVVFWDVYGEQGCPVRATLTDIGPTLLARILELSEAQEGALIVAYKVADEEKVPLLDLKDIRAWLTDLSGRAAEIGAKYGLISASSIAAIQRKLLQLDMQGADEFFGEPALDINDLIRTAPDGRGIVNVLAADKLVRNPRLYAMFLLWLMSELWEELPEIGDPQKPKLVFFFDEAHLLFDDAPKALLDKIEQVARLIRSKGVGIYFVTQSPADIPDSVLAQLGNRVQHALRAYTPADQKAVKAAAASFRAPPGLDVVRAIQELSVGEALVSTLDTKGAPTPVARTQVRPPASRVGPVSSAERTASLAACPMEAKYKQVVDRDSAYEILARRAGAVAAPPTAQAPTPVKRAPPPKPAKPSPRVTMIEKKAVQVGGRVLTTIATSLARDLMRGILGGRRRR